MDGLEIKNEPPLPPGYVSLAQLQERWLQRQQEKKMKEKQQQEEEKEAKKQSNVHAKMEGGSIRYGREVGVIEEKGKGKEIEIGGSENGEKKKLKKKKKYRPRFRNKKSKNGANNEKPVSGIRNYDEGLDGGKGVEIISRNEVKIGIAGGSSGENSVREINSDEMKGIEGTVSVAMVEVLPRNVGYRGGVSRNGENRGSVYKGRREYIVKQQPEVKNNEVGLDSKNEMGNGKGYGKKWSKKKAYGSSNGERGYSLKESNEDETLDSEIYGAKGKERNGKSRQRRNIRNKIKEKSIEGGEGLKDETLDSEIYGAKGKEKNGKSRQRRNIRNKIKEKSIEGGEGLDVSSIGRRFGGLTLNDRRADNVKSNIGEGGKYGRKYRKKMKHRDSNSSSMVWLKKEVKSEVDYSGTLVDQE